MANDTPSSILKRIIFISVVLGTMFGSGLILILRAIFKPDLSLIPVVLPMFIIAILMVGALIRLRRTNDIPSSILKRIIFISVVLGTMFGPGLGLTLRAIFKPDLSLIPVVLPMFIIAILMVRALIRLRRTIDRTG